MNIVVPACSCGTFDAIGGKHSDPQGGWNGDIIRGCFALLSAVFKLSAKKDSFHGG